ncbi:MAG: hypothetical protein K0S11_1007 [Gammaproteobacteria bacterium]|jgi:Zn-dependent protease|nr:hypothetical protein [Gammaproteobacteria bacterium]
MLELTIIQKITVAILPLPNLDGSRVLMSITPNKVSEFYHRLEPYGLFIFLALLLLPPSPPGLLGYLISPLIKFFISALVSPFGI